MAKRQRSEVIDLTNSPETKPAKNPRPPSSAQAPAFFLTHVDGAHNDYALRLSDLVPDAPVRYLLLSDFMYDLFWVYEECPQLFAAREILIVHGHGEPAPHMTAFRESFVAAHPKSRMSLHAPPTPKFGTHHTKMMIFVCEEAVRLVIHTCNMVQSDWYGKSQAAWARDFPRRGAAGTKGTQFAADLDDYLRHVGAPLDRVRGMLEEYDFGGAGGHLVASVPGAHKSNKYGHRKVRQLLNGRPPIPSSDPLVCQFSSLGSLSDFFIVQQFGKSFAGSADVDIKLVWPSIEQVRTSLQGYDSGGTLCCTTKNLKPCIRSRLFRWDGGPSRRERAMPHIKTYCRVGKDRLHWVLLTSANFSQVAWGAIWKNEYSISSFELGVLLLPETYTPPRYLLGGPIAAKWSSALAPSRGHSDAWRFVQSSSGDSNLGPSDVPVPLPYNTGPGMFGKDDADQPWRWDQNIDKPDVFGRPFTA